MVIRVSALRHLQLAEQHRARFLQAAYNSGIVMRMEILMDRHAARGGEALGPKQILHRDRNAVHGPAIMARRDFRLRRRSLSHRGLSHRGLRHHQRVAPKRRIDRGDAIELQSRCRNRRNPTRPDVRGQLGELEIVEIGFGGAHRHSSKEGPVR
jgi:hypothetical protein